MHRAPWTSGASGARPARLPRARRIAAALAALALAAGPRAARAGDAGGRPGLAASAVAFDARPFEEALDRFVPDFPATTARYFPFTDLGPRPGDAIAAPAEVERYAVVEPPPPRSAAVLGVWAPAAAPVTAAPHPLVRLSAGGALSRAWSAPGSAFASTGWQATVAAPSGAWRDRVAATFAEEVRGASAGQGARVGSQSTAALQLRLAAPLTLGLEGHRIAERGGPGDGVTDSGARATASLALLPRVLELGASAGTDRVQADADAVATGRTSASAGFAFHLVPALTLSGSTAVQDGVLSGAATANALFGQLPASRITTGAVSWRASDRLLLSGSLSRVDTPLGAETARQVHLAWSPRPGGLLGLAASYEESVDPATGTRTAQAVLQPSLHLGRYALLAASVTQALRAVAGPVAHPLAVMVSFSVGS